MQSSPGPEAEPRRWADVNTRYQNSNALPELNLRLINKGRTRIGEPKGRQAGSASEKKKKPGRKRYTYDPNGNMTSDESDLDGDGLFEDVRHYRYDTRGNAIVVARVEMPDGRITERSRMTYDERGNQTSWLRHKDDDGQIDERFLYVYDARGNLTSFEHDKDGDGVIDVRERRFYDSEGKLVKKHRTDPSGTWQTTNDYACLAKTIPKAPRRRIKGQKLQPTSSGE